MGLRGLFGWASVHVVFPKAITFQEPFFGLLKAILLNEILSSFLELVKHAVGGHSSEFDHSHHSLELGN